MTDLPPKSLRRHRPPSKTDHAILAELLALHAVGDHVLDASWGDGGIWSAALLERYRPISLDLRPEVSPDVVGDWNCLGDLFGAQAFSTIVWDPPHMNDAGSTGIVGGRSWGDRYGTLTAGLKGTSVCGLFEPFLVSARHVLDPLRGTLLVKIADQVHNGPLQWQPFELRNTALALGWLDCDYQVRQRAQLPGSMWKVQHHVRRGATFWMVFHTGARCPSPGLPLVRVCAGDSDGHLFKPRRRDQLTCGDRCRQRRHRDGVAMRAAS